MPQMAPLNWLTLMLLFSMILIMISIMNFSVYNQMPKNYLLNKFHSSKIWKW
uniref:ATP synthase complex subunit 8 n=1 Tax=Hemisodorcus derelictus TaxID=617864 RepID=A0AA51UNQ8_9SCAR|nr:ATP synthase F0 subunit 8 [Hemisodorcus derelictus]WMW30172.1 ATP synthase F0 subunit 8 [Hemisodorcus derelictus]